MLKDRYEAGLASIADADVADRFREWSAMYTGVEGAVTPVARLEMDHRGD